VQGFPVWE